MKYPDPEEVLSGILSEAYNAGYDYDFSDPAHIVFIARDQKNPMPIIRGEFQTDANKKHFWWETHMEFPDRLDEGEYEGHFHSVVNDWLRATVIADYLGSKWWKIEDGDIEEMP